MFHIAAHAETWFESLIMPGELASDHAKLETNCENCHNSFDQTGQSKLCLDCHKAVSADITGTTGFHGRSSEARTLACSTCHNDHQGRDFVLIQLDSETFDHAITDFALVGAHLDAECESCHLPGKKFAEAPSDCAACHKEADPHKGALGAKCGDCHTGARWQEVRGFDHSKTRFALDGKHVALDCVACHDSEVWKGLPLACEGCHLIDDPHGSRFPVCGNCHSVARWETVRFDHDKDSKFALAGKHSKIGCADCHMPDVAADEAPTDCIGCHADEDVHRTQLGKNCAACHGTASWEADVIFDHGLTRMPLLGFHAVVQCESCHSSNDFAGAEPACEGCHSAEDAHKATLGPDCGTCHTPNGWAFWQYDHDLETSFALTGAHRGLVCDACHTPGTVAQTVPSDCATCHRADDIHKGAFGTRCEGCHNSTSFKDAQLKLRTNP